MATHAGTVIAGFLEIETGAEFDRLNGTRTLLVPTVLKFGAARRVQVSVFANVLGPQGEATGFGDAALGVKWRMVDKAPLFGDFAVLPSLKFPTGSTRAGRGTGTTDVSLLLVSSHDVGGVAMDLNAGLTKRSGDGSDAPRVASVWTLSLGGSACGALGWVAELFGYPGTSGPRGSAPTVALLAGPTLLVRTWLAVDVGFITPIQGPQPHALYAGAVYNVGRWR